MSISACQCTTTSVSERNFSRLVCFWGVELVIREAELLAAHQPPWVREVTMHLGRLWKTKAIHWTMALVIAGQDWGDGR